MSLAFGVVAAPSQVEHADSLTGGDSNILPYFSPKAAGDLAANAARSGTTPSAQGFTWRSSRAGVSASPAMHLAGAWVNGLTAKGAWCSITVPEHGMRLPAPVAGTFSELGTSTDDYGEWSVKRGDWSFQVDDAAFRAGGQAVGRSFAKLISDTMAGRK